MATPATAPVFRIYREPLQFPITRRLTIAAVGAPGDTPGPEAIELVYLEPPLDVEILESVAAFPIEPEVHPDPEPVVDHGVGDAILAILGASSPCEPVRVMFERKERALAELFNSLAPPAARALERRLRAASPGDVAASAFDRMVPERKERLVVLLAAVARGRLR